MLEKLATGLPRPINNKMVINVFFHSLYGYCMGIVQEVFDLGKDRLAYLSLYFVFIAYILKNTKHKIQLTMIRIQEKS